MKLSPEIKLLLECVDEAYQKKAWHGPNLRGSIRGLNAQFACRRPADNRHNIREIVVHCAYWKYVVRRRITHEKRNSFPLKGSNWFKMSVRLSETAWKEDVKLLDTMHRSMVEAIKNIKPSELKKTPAAPGRNIRLVIFGIAAHDVYHAGQIQLLKKLLQR